MARTAPHQLAAAMALAGLAVGGAGCASNTAPVRRPEAPANVTYPLAFGNYQRVYNTTYHVVNRYAVVKSASYRYGQIEAELGQDNAFMDKTRRTILARIFDAGEYWDVECRVLLQIEDSDVESLNEHQPRYNWRTVAGDAILETKLNNEIKAALSGGAWDAKQPLVPDQAVMPLPARPRVKHAPAESAPGAGDDEGDEHGAKPEKRPSNLRDASAPAPAETPATPALPPRTARACPVGGLGEVELERVGLALLERGDYARATSAFQAARDARPSGGYAPFLLAQAAFATGDYALAARSIREGAARNPQWTSSRGRLDVRTFYGETADLTEQLATLDTHAKAHPDDADAALVQGYMAYFTRDFRRAEQVFAGLATRAPSDELVVTLKRLSLLELDRARGLSEF